MLWSHRQGKAGQGNARQGSREVLGCSRVPRGLHAATTPATHPQRSPVQLNSAQHGQARLRAAAVAHLGVSASMGMLRNTAASGDNAQSGRLRVLGRARLRVTPSCSSSSKAAGTAKQLCHCHHLCAASWVFMGVHASHHQQRCAQLKDRSAPVRQQP